MVFGVKTENSYKDTHSSKHKTLLLFSKILLDLDDISCAPPPLLQNTEKKSWLWFSFLARHRCYDTTGYETHSSKGCSRDPYPYNTIWE